MPSKVSFALDTGAWRSSTTTPKMRVDCPGAAGGAGVVGCGDGARDAVGVFVPQASKANAMTQITARLALRRWAGGLASVGLIGRVECPFSGRQIRLDLRLLISQRLGVIWRHG